MGELASVWKFRVTGLTGLFQNVLWANKPLIREFKLFNKVIWYMTYMGQGGYQGML